MEWAAVILAGGTSRRWGGRDKTAVPLAGRPVLRHVVDAVLPDAVALAVVAPSDHPARPGIEEAARRAGLPVAWTREEPPGGGPSAGLAAGLEALASLGPPAPAVVVLAGDLPFARTAWPRLLAALHTEGETGGTAAGDATGEAAPDVALGLDPGGHRQPLLAAYRTEPLRRRLAGLAPQGAPLRVLLDGALVAEVPVSAREALDLDTPDDAAEAERILAKAAG